MTKSSVEKRRFSRIHFQAAVSISGGPALWHASLLDISLKGILVNRPNHFPQTSLGETFKIDVKPADAPYSIRMVAKAMHIENGHIGFQCVSIDLDSITHLRRLVELNLGDVNLLERELAHLVENIAA
ncbi:MAG: PilZ domain-containing protein [Gammaproteobacteria bacterium]|nr:PilZ domain-containing protein [Gammaproteobacteria bacterium]